MSSFANTLLDHHVVENARMGGDAKPYSNNLDIVAHALVEGVDDLINARALSSADMQSKFAQEPDSFQLAFGGLYDFLLFPWNNKNVRS